LPPPRPAPYAAATKTGVTADTVGAGDTFQAALLTFLSERQLDTPEGLATLSRELLDEMLSFAVGAAALTCTKVGPDLPYRHQLG
ncbi:PfkB family carbohydrate kinase, partial [Pseudomonas syringae]|uniref:PfkB family carbohydrate kinase n=1 Tax=Pseudomonas syringae TaxID=317 RepID=UPI001F1CB336